MYPVSSEFIREISQGATIVTKASVQRGRLPLPGLEDIPISSGSITMDTDSVVRTRLSATIGVGEDVLRYVPAVRFLDDFGFWPSGSEINIQQGIRYRNGALGTEWVNLGWYQIAKPHVVDNGDDLIMTVDGWDMGRRISRCKLTDAYNIPYGGFVPDVIMRSLMHGANWLTEDDFDFESVQNIISVVPHLVMDRGDDIWDINCKMARSYGLDLSISPDKKIRMRPIPDVGFSDPVITYEEGEFNIVNSISRTLDDHDAINGVVVISENSSNPVVVRGEAWDMDLSSPTYFDPKSPGSSMYGPNPITISDKFVTDQASADARAFYEFTLRRGILETVSIEAIPMFAHEGFDLIGLCRTRAGIDGDYILRSSQLGLGAQGSLSATMQSRLLT